ncbi:MAG: lipid biosynthesis B12-binding/radical SAM protein [Desulfobacula sp.]
MSRVLLISSNTTIDPMPVYPLGMALIASSLVQAGHHVKQLDLILDPDRQFFHVAEAISEFDPDFIGVSIRNIDTVDSLSSQDTWYLCGIRELLKHIQKLTSKPVILGGSAFSIMPEQILAFLNADFGIVGEGEILIRQLIHDILNDHDPPKIMYPSQPQMDANDFYSPLYEPVLAEYYFNHSGMLNYQTKRGCPYGCNYCSYPVIEGKKIRYQEPEFIVENLMALKEKFGIDTVFFTDSIFNDPKDHYLKVAELMIRKNCGIRWAAYFRPEKITRDKLKILIRSGLYAMEIGSDAASDTTLAGMNKSYRVDTIFAMNEACKKESLACAHFFIFGGADETRATVLEGIKNIERLESCAAFIFSGIRIFPHTGIHRIAIRQGVVLAEDTLLEPCYYVSPEVDKVRMDDTLKSAFKKRKDRFFPPEEGYMRMKAMKLFGFKGLLWDKAIHIQKLMGR